MTSAYGPREINEILTFTRRLARAGGDVALSYFGRANPMVKFDESLITEADLAVQDRVKQEVLKNYPDHRFLGEEDETRLPLSDYMGPLWVVDPIDGTAAFCRGMPVWSISIAFFLEQVPMVGAVYLPVTGEMYCASNDGPALLNDNIIEVRDDEVVDNESLLLTYSRFHRNFRSTFPGKIRSLGSTAAHIAYVARGSAWGALMTNVHIWDVAGAMVILEAAGGVLRTFDGKPFEPGAYLDGQNIRPPLLASAKQQHRTMRDYVTLQYI